MSDGTMKFTAFIIDLEKAFCILRGNKLVSTPGPQSFG